MAAPSNFRPPLALPGFEHVRRAWHDVHDTYAARLLPGEYYVTKTDEAVYTTLGSCISACVRDRVTGVGGMNHFMLPASVSADRDGWRSTSLSEATRYGNFAMEHLINDILKNGGQKRNLEVKIFASRFLFCPPFFRISLIKCSIAKLP